MSEFKFRSVDRGWPTSEGLSPLAPGWESPFKIYQSDIENVISDEMVKATFRVGITVDKEELLKALSYDRDQYSKGYAAGRRGREKVVRGRECIHNVANHVRDSLDTTDYSGKDIVCAFWLSDGLEPDDYCSRGKMKGDSL